MKKEYDFSKGVRGKFHNPDGEFSMDEYKRSFSVIEAYAFLNRHGLEKESEDIRISPTTFKSYTSTLRRAKIVVLVKQHGLFQEFCNEVWPSGLTKKGESRARFFENLAKRSMTDEEGITTEEEDELIAEDNEFAYENDLQNYLVKNLGVIEKGLKLYQAENGQSGVEFYIPGTSRRIDILAVDQNGIFVVIELKVSRGYERVVGQTLYYQSMIKTLFDQKKVRSIIVAREISVELKAATQFLNDFELFEYQLSLTLNKIT